MGRNRHQHTRSPWTIPAVLTATAVVVSAGVYLWHELDDDNNASGLRSEEETDREAYRGLSSRSATGPSAAAAAARAAVDNNNGSNNGGVIGGVTGIGLTVGKYIRGFFDSSDDEGSNGRSSAGNTSRSVGGQIAGSTSRSMNVDTSSTNRGAQQQQMDWNRKKIIALVISATEDVEESLLLHLPTPLDLSRCILLVFIYTPAVLSPPSLRAVSPRPIPYTPSRQSDNPSYTSPAASVTSNYSVKSFARTQPSPPMLSADSSPSLHPAMRTPLTSGRTSRADELLDDEDLLSTPTPADRYGIRSKSRTQSSASDGESYSKQRRPTKRSASGRQIYAATDSDNEDDDKSSQASDSTLPSLVSKTFGRGFPQQQIMNYSTPTGVVHMLRHLGVSIVFMSESCASVPPSAGSEEESRTNSSSNTTSLNNPQPPSSTTTTQPPGSTNFIGGGEIIGMLKDWVGEIVLVLDEDEDDSGPTVPSAVSGGEDEFSNGLRDRKGKDRARNNNNGNNGRGALATGRKRKWLDKEKGVGKGITTVERARFAQLWRARVEGR